MDLISNAIITFKEIIINPYIIICYLIIGFILYRKNKRDIYIQDNSSIKYLGNYSSHVQGVFTEIIIGFTFGILCIIIMNYFGITFKSYREVGMLFLTSLLLAKFNNRFFCFAYSSSFLLLSLIIVRNIFGDEATSFVSFDTENIILFVGIMHLLEGVMILIDGHRDAIPVAMEKDGVVAGGFRLKRFWPVMIGILGYSSYTFTMHKREKSILSGICTMIYGSLIMLDAKLVGLGIAWEIISITLMVLGHEFMIKIQRLIEKNRELKYISTAYNTVILDVIKGSEAYKIGLRSGDVIKKVDLINNVANLSINKENGKNKNVILSSKDLLSCGVVIVPTEINNKSVKNTNHINYKDQRTFKEIYDIKKNR